MKYYPAFVAKRLKKKVIGQIDKRVLKSVETEENCTDQVADLPATGRDLPCVSGWRSVGGEGGVERVGIAVGIGDCNLLRTEC